MNFLKRLFDQDYRELKKFSVIADKIEELEEEYSKLSDYELKAKTDEFKNRLENGETLDDILVELNKNFMYQSGEITKEEWESSGEIVLDDEENEFGDWRIDIDSS